MYIYILLNSFVLNTFWNNRVGLKRAYMGLCPVYTDWLLMRMRMMWCRCGDVDMWNGDVDMWSRQLDWLELGWLLGLGWHLELYVRL